MTDCSGIFCNPYLCPTGDLLHPLFYPRPIRYIFRHISIVTNVVNIFTLKLNLADGIYQFLLNTNASHVRQVL